jgi:hypothetical protein
VADPDASGTGTSTNERELQRSSQAFLAELAHIERLEQRKREMSAGDDARVPLAHEIEALTVGLLGLSRYQTRLIELESLSLGTAQPDPRKPAAILAEWRDAERALRDARAAMERAADAAERLRHEHGRAVRHLRAP